MVTKNWEGEKKSGRGKKGKERKKGGKREREKKKEKEMERKRKKTKMKKKRNKRGRGEKRKGNGIEFCLKVVTKGPNCTKSSKFQNLPHSVADAPPGSSLILSPWTVRAGYLPE